MESTSGSCGVGGLSINASQGTITLSNNIIDGNSKEAVLYIYTNLVVTVTDNTIVNNSGTGVSISPYSSDSDNYFVTFTGNTIINNHNDGGSGGKGLCLSL